MNQFETFHCPKFIMLNAFLKEYTRFIDVLWNLERGCTVVVVNTVVHTQRFKDLNNKMMLKHKQAHTEGVLRDQNIIQPWEWVL